MPRRWQILVVGLPLYTFALMLLVTIVLGLFFITDWSNVTARDFLEGIADLVFEPGWWAWVGTIVPVMVALQAVFLVPVLARRPPREQRSRPLVVSLLIGGLWAGLLTGAFGAAVGDFLALLVDPLEEVEDKPEWMWLLMSCACRGGCELITHAICSNWWRTGTGMRVFLSLKWMVRCGAMSMWWPRRGRSWAG